MTIIDGEGFDYREDDIHVTANGGDIAYADAVVFLIAGCDALHYATLRR